MMLNKFQQPIKSTLLMILPLLIFTGCGGSDNQNEKVVFTQLNEVLVDSKHDCRQALIDVGNELIGDKTHYLQLVKTPSKNESADSSESQTIISESVINGTSNIMISGLLEYNDRPSHVRFDAFKTSHGSDSFQCVVSYQLDYHFDDPCIMIREDAFKKWIKVGDLGEKSQYYVHKRMPNKKVYLTNLSRNTQCLASVRSIEEVPIHK